MFLTKRSWPGTSTNPKAPFFFKEGKSQINRDAAALFLFQAVGICAGQGFDKGRFAVIDVSGGSNNYVSVESTVPILRKLRLGYPASVHCLLPSAAVKRVHGCRRSRLCERAFDSPKHT